MKASGDILVGFLDDVSENSCLVPILEYVNYTDCEFIIGIGDASIRKRISALPCKWYTAIHPTAVVSPSAQIGIGTTVMPNAIINADAKAGKHCIINTGSIVEHDITICDFAHISVGAKLGGTVAIDKSTWIGIGATVKNNTSICPNCIVGAGAVVICDLIENGTYVGVPAKVLK